MISHERLPLLRQRVLREDRLDRALRLARTAVDALLGVDDEDAARLVDAVHGADVDARAVFDVDAGLGDDVRHGGNSTHRPADYSAEVSSSSITCRVRSKSADLAIDLVEPGSVRAAQPGGVRVIRVAQDRHVRVVVRDVVRVDPRDVGDHEVGRVDRVRGREPMLRKQRLELAADEEVDPTQQDRRHACGRP